MDRPEARAPGRSVPVILGGGGGTRLWPVSRDSCPKQFLKILQPTSSLQQAVLRVTAEDVFARPIVMTIEPYRFLVRQQLEEIGCDAEIVIEPERRDSGPAILAAALLVPPETVLLVSAADHLIEDRDGFLDDFGNAAIAAERGALVTFGIVPRRVTGAYGYIRPGEPLEQVSDVWRVARFVEKPGLAAAEQLIAEGCVWNSGNFVFRADMVVDQYQQFDPSTVAAVRDSLAKAERDLGFLRLDRTAFAAARRCSFDYAVMERTDRAAVVRARFDWSDLGDWEAVWRHLPHDAQGNALSGQIELLDARNNLIYADSGMVAVADVDDLVVVASGDAVLVADRRRPERVKQLVEKVQARGHRQGSEHLRNYRPWGWYQTMDSGQRFQVKRIAVRPGCRLSLQRHHHRAEHWVVVRGTAEVTINGTTAMLSENESTYIPIGSTHRLANPGRIELELIEVQTGSYLGEDDIVRLEDDFSRRKGE
jgi:mannose-1-phosphate guanylyltransferase/mannose-6-phosphate isomerase